MLAQRESDRDEGFEEDSWQSYETRELGLIIQAPLRADKLWKELDGQGDDRPAKANSSASVAISGLVHSRDVTAPTSCLAVGVTTLVGVR